jgi:indolepyruvate ferredoxin oxidoreductase alpha subunit
MQERSHAFAMKAQMWLLDPRPNLPSIVQGGEGRVRPVRGLEHPGDADGAHPVLPCHRQLSPARDNKRPR